MEKDKKKLRFVGKMDEEDQKNIEKILNKLDPDNKLHAVDILCFSLILGTSQNLFVMLGRLELMKQRVFSFADQPELFDELKDIEMEEIAKKELKKQETQAG